MQTHWRKSVAAIAFGLVLLSGQAVQAQALNFYKNYFVTGDYEVGGVGLKGTGVNGMATGTIDIPDGFSFQCTAFSSIFNDIGDGKNQQRRNHKEFPGQENAIAQMKHQGGDTN